jgi:hypothetical protein
MVRYEEEVRIVTTSGNDEKGVKKKGTASVRATYLP